MLFKKRGGLIYDIKEMKERNQKHLCVGRRPLKSKLEVILNGGICSYDFKRWKSAPHLSLKSTSNADTITVVPVVARYLQSQ